MEISLHKQATIEPLERDRSEGQWRGAGSSPTGSSVRESVPPRATTTSTASAPISASSTAWPRPRHPQTNGMVERFNGRIEDVLQSHHFNSGEDLEQTILRYVRLYNGQFPQSALKGQTPVDALKDWQRQRLNLLLRALLRPHGFHQVPQPDSWEHNFVLRNPEGEVIDVHSHELNADRSNRIGAPYIAGRLRVDGDIAGTKVICVPLERLVRFHTGYEVDESDWHDVRLPCEEFGLPIPSIYARFQRG